MYSNRSSKSLLTGLACLLMTVVSSSSLAVESNETVEGTKAITKVLTKAPSDTGFKALDGNSDGKISIKEAIKNPELAEQFDQRDVNEDGDITAEEYAMFSVKTNKEQM